MSSNRTLCLACVEAVALSFFLDRIISKPGSMISDFLYSDPRFKFVITLHVLLHTAVMFFDSALVSQQCVLALSAFGWVLLLLVTIHISRTWHFIGVGVHCTGFFLFGLLICPEINAPWFEVLLVDLVVCFILAMCYWYLCLSLSDKAYIPQHVFFFLGQVSCAMVVHFRIH